MAVINIPAYGQDGIPTEGLIRTGTTSDDTITITDPISLVVRDAGSGATLDGRGGRDTIILNGNSFVKLTEDGTSDAEATEKISYDKSTDTWTIDGVALTNGFRTVTLSDGVTLVAGEASSGVIGANIVATAVTDTSSWYIGQYKADLVVKSFEWSGESVSDTVFDVFRVVSVDGQLVSGFGPGQDVGTAGSAGFGMEHTFTNADGTFRLYKNSGENNGDGGFDLLFEPHARAIAAQGTVGDTAIFAYDVLVADADGNTQMLTVSFSHVIEFSGGDDTFVGTDENDYVGADITTTSSEEQTLLSDKGNAGAGDDNLKGMGGRDYLVGGVDDDLIRGGNDDDTLRGGDDDDNLGGGSGDDAICGDAGGDKLFGSFGNDTLKGGAGDDVLSGGSGDDILIGGDISGAIVDIPHSPQNPKFFVCYDPEVV